MFKGPKTYPNDDLATTWRRISRHDWATKYSKVDPRLRHLRAVRERRDGMTAVICLDDDWSDLEVFVPDDDDYEFVQGEVS